MKCLRSGTARNTPSRPDADSQIHVCTRVSCTSKPLPGSAARMSKAASSQQRNAIWPAVVPGRLDDVVLPAVVALREQPEREEPEERRDDRDVRAEAELEHDVGIRGADDQRDEEADGDRARRQFSDMGRLERSESHGPESLPRWPPDSAHGVCSSDPPVSPIGNRRSEHVYLPGELVISVIFPYPTKLKPVATAANSRHLTGRWRFG